MKKSFLLLLLMTLLPLAGWAQTASWVGGSAPDDLVYGDAVPDFSTLVSVVSSYGDHSCANDGEGTAAPGGAQNAYRWKLSKGGSNVDGTQPLEVGDYTLTLYIHHRNSNYYSGGGGNAQNYGSTTRTLTFSVAKKEVTVSLFQVVREWRNPWVNPDVSTLEATAYSVAGANWDDVKGYLVWDQVQAVVDAGAYKYTLKEETTNPNYIIHFDATKADLKVEQNTTAYWDVTATDGANLTYNGEEQTLEPTDAPVLLDTDGNVAGTIEYSVDGGTTWSADYPKAKDAGTYTIDYKAVDDTNHDNSGVAQGTYTVVIDPYEITTADFNEPTGLTDKVYDGTAQTIAVAATWKDGALKAELEAGAEFWYSTDATLTQGTNAGKYNVEYTINVTDANFVWNGGVVTLVEAAEILKADLEPQDQSTLVVTGLKYNAANQKLLKGEAALPEFKNVGRAGTFTYYVDGTSVGTNWEDVVGKDADVDANAYVITYTFVPTSTNFNAITTPQPIGDANIAKATVTVTGVAAREDVVYNADDQMLLKSGATVTTSYGPTLSSPAEFTIEYTWPNNSVSGWKSVMGKNAGTYEINYQVTPKDLKNFVIPAAGKVTAEIGKCEVDVAAATKILNYGEYVVTPEMLIIVDENDVPAKETLTPEEIGVIVAQFKDGWTIPDPQDAGAYPFSLEPKENTNYKINKFDPDGGITIKKIPAVPATVAAATLTYTAADQELVTVGGASDGGTMMYYLETEETGAGPINAGDARWSTTVPKAKNAGDYKVWTMIQGDKNHDDVVAAAAVPVTIAKAGLAIAVAPQTKVYGADDPELTATFTKLLGEDKKEDLGFAISRAAGENVGEYAITATVDNEKETTKNYNVTITNNKLTITAAELAIEIDDKEKVYGNEDPAFTAAFKGLTNGDEPDDIALSFSRVAGEDVIEGGYEISATATGAAASNYTIKFTNGKLTIKKAPLTLTAKALTKVYEEEDPELILAEEPAYKNGDNAEKIGLTITREAGEDVGEYEITPAATSGNYEYTVYTATFTITKQPVTPTAPTANILTYNGKDQALVAAGSAKGSTIQYALDEGDFGDDVPTAKNAGTYTVKYKFTPGDNFSIAEPEGEFTVKILQAHVAFRMGKQVETYTGEAFTPKEGEAYTLSEGGFFTGDEDVVTFDFLEDFDATTACEEGRAFEKLAYTFNSEVENYTIEFQNQGLLIIKKAAPADFTAPAANDLTYNGLSQKLVTEGSVAKVDDKPLGTIMFSNKKDGEYTTDVPEGTDAKDYDVWFKVVGDANHSDSEPAKVADVKIKPFALFADMIKAETLSKPYTAAVQSFPMSLKVKLAADKKDPRTLVDNQDYTVKINDKEVKDVVIKNAGAYVYTFTGKGNYTGTVTTTANITKGELIATAPNAVKTYDGTAVIEPEEFECTATQLKLYGGLEISGLLADDKIDLGDKTIADIIVPEGSAINVGEYNLKVNLAAIPVQANYTFNPQTFNGKLTINKAEAVKIGFFTWEEPNTEEAFWGTTIVKTKEYSKSYGTADPVFITEKGTNDVTSISGDLMALEGELFEDKAVVATLLGATRTAGEVYTKDGYTVKLGWKNTSNTAELAKIATFKNNYKNVTFGTTKLNITPFEGTIKVSIKSMATTFDGNDHAGDCTWAADLSNMVVVGLPAGKDKKEIFTELPTITVTPKDGKVRNAGDYNITLSGGKSDNYDMKKVQFVLGSYLTVEPFEITPDMVTIPDQQVKIGDKAKDVIKHDAFTFAEGALPVAEDANLFQVVAAPDFIDANGKIKLGADPAEGLILARKDNTNAEALNYIGYDEVFGYLSIIGTPDLLVLDDTKDIATKDRENTDVTFTNRSIRQDDWNVLCLPFDATIKEISDAFGYAAVDLLKKESVDGSMHFVVTTSGTVPAGEPFIIKPTSDPELNAKSNFVQVKFTGVTVKEFSDNPEPVKDSAGNKFCGTFKAQTTFFGEKFWYMSKSEWKQASNFTEANPQKLGAYRAYIETATAGARIFIEEPDGTITAITAIDLNNNTMDEGWYTVNGMKLNAAPTQKGTYIKDGKKVFVK